MVTRHLMQYDCLSIVVTRDERNDYIDALESAEDGDLSLLVASTRRLRHVRSCRNHSGANEHERRNKTLRPAYITAARKPRRLA